VAHRSGLLYQRRFDPAAEGNVHYDLKLGYASSHSWALDAVDPSAKVLDIGSGPGGLATELVKKGCDVTVVDQFEPTESHEKVAVHVQDLDAAPTFDAGSADTILMLDVIEHLRRPELFLEQVRKQFGHTPKKLVLTTPNIAFFVQRLMLAAGQFNYGKAGILDATHTRLFTFRTIRHLLRDAGFRIKEIRGVPAPFPKVFGDGVVGKAAVKANEALIKVSRSLFSYQIFIVAESTPDVEFVLRNTKEKSHERAAQARAAEPRRDEGPVRARSRREANKP
jgi:2-polyprenyl-3-methyl-5-hydroxy-6-metoxy-1,4-benzoquinol methylase